MRKLLALVLALVMTLGLATVGTNAFTDDTAVAATDYETAIKVLEAMGVFTGYEDGSFQPDKTISRAEVAAIIYRIATADVTGAKVDNYTGLANFTDMAGYGWAAGYIGYCANAGYVKGYGNGKFGPGDPVTGYQACAMILRAVGYDKNHEWEGAGYEVKVASTAQELGMLKTVAPTNLTGSASRGAVAQILWDALLKPTVEYTNAFGYQNKTVGTLMTGAAALKESLGGKNFSLTAATKNDDWGRPFNGYTFSTGKKSYYKQDTPIFTTNKIELGCDVYAGIGKVSSIAAANRWLNGTVGAATAAATVVNDNTAKFVDSQTGRQIEFYDMGDDVIREVIIDTYLARVTATVAEQKDANGHVTRDDYNTLMVYDLAGKTASLNGGTVRHLDGNEYATGDYILVNVNTTKTYSPKLFVGVPTDAENKVYAVQKAESTEAAQTKIFYDQAKHEVGGKEYLDAFMFRLDEAGTTLTYKMQWFLDQFGNLIGDVNINRNDYAVLESIHYITGTTEYAEAVLRYFDGSTKTVTVRHMDGFGNTDAQIGVPAIAGVQGQGWRAPVDDATFRLAESANEIGYIAGTAAGTSWNTRAVSVVSSSTALNAAAGFNGLALYRVFTYDDGSVDLEAFEQGTGRATSNVLAPNPLRNPNVNAATNVVADTDDTLDVKFVDGATVDATASAVTVDGAARTHFNANTKFIYRTGTLATGYTYTTYTGTANLPSMVAGTAEVFFDGTLNTVSNYVYVKTFTPSVLVNSRHVFIPVNNSQYETTAGSGIWVIGAVIDGVDGTVRGTQAQIRTLAENKGKLFHMTFVAAGLRNAGNIQSFDLVNEATDEEFNNGVNAYNNGVPTDNHWRGPVAANNIAGACDYLAVDTGTVAHISSASYGATTLVVNDLPNNLSYNLTNARFHGEVADLAGFEALVTNGGLTSKGVWVVFDHVAGNAFNQALDVYVGTKLSNDTGLTAVTYSTAARTGAANINGTVIATTARTNNGHNDTGAITFNMNAGQTVAYMAYAPTHNNATFAYIAKANNNNVRGTLTSDNTDVTGAAIAATAGNEAVEQINVLAEDGWHRTTYAVTANFNNLVAAMWVGPNAADATTRILNGTADETNAKDLLVAQTTKPAVTAATIATDIDKAAQLALVNGEFLAPDENAVTPVNSVYLKVLPQTGVSVRLVSAENIETAAAALMIPAGQPGYIAPVASPATAGELAAGNTVRNGGVMVVELTDAAKNVSYIVLPVFPDNAAGMVEVNKAKADVAPLATAKANANTALAALAAETDEVKANEAVATAKTALETAMKGTDPDAINTAVDALNAAIAAAKGVQEETTTITVGAGEEYASIEAYLTAKNQKIADTGLESITVKDGGKLTIAADLTVKDVTATGEGSKLDIAAGITVTITGTLSIDDNVTGTWAAGSTVTCDTLRRPDDLGKIKIVFDADVTAENTTVYNP